MSPTENDRRDFLKIASAAVVSGSIGSTVRADAARTPKILNCSPTMNYRRLGKTEFMISRKCSRKKGCRRSFRA
ncbi:MAG: twin-arginine translocation signal domain-containing protein [Planctomycetes bacterium]|nr:twin-arginine translocation signal domain-containing protein [Planctomycetota bacterium]